MRKAKPPKPIYTRGPFRLYRRGDRTSLEIRWYDAATRRERSVSAGTSDDGEGRAALDRHYLESHGQRYCETCGRPLDREAAPLLLQAITDYLILSEAKAGYKATKGRLAHVVTYLAETNPAMTCGQADAQWIAGFRRWLALQPVVKGGETRERAIGGVEGVVRQLAAAINATPGQAAQFQAKQPRAVAKSPEYRADVPTLAAMFRFALEKSERGQLLAYLRCAVATWARPEEIFDLGQGQWNASARVLNLNPPNRVQTRKYRTRVPIGPAFAPYLDAMKGPYMTASTVRAPWDKMRVAVGLPGASGEAGVKLVRRSMATICRRYIGEANWRQGEMMLGHVKSGISDVYALPDPANLGLALAATDRVIAEVTSLCPEAYRKS